MNVLYFYSNNCNYSRKFNRLLEKYGNIGLDAYCIEELEEVPEFLSCTPSLLIEDDEQNVLYEGQEVFDWYYEILIESSNKNKQLTEEEFKSSIGISTKKGKNVTENSMGQVNSKPPASSQNSFLSNSDSSQGSKVGFKTEKLDTESSPEEIMKRLEQARAQSA